MSVLSSSSLLFMLVHVAVALVSMVIAESAPEPAGPSCFGRVVVCRCDLPPASPDEGSRLGALPCDDAAVLSVRFRPVDDEGAGFPSVSVSAVTIPVSTGAGALKGDVGWRSSTFSARFGRLS
ncbi:hypothetical protein ERJ75_001791000 [Trypanosoma vivax]|nr:hypothetical protein ERJ75_001791000 [Trypanosoma vivax]